MVLLSFSAAAQREKSDPSIKPGSFTVIGSVGFPKMSAVSREHEKSFKAMLLGGVDYQATREFIIGLQYAYNHSSHDFLPVKSYFAKNYIQQEASATWHTLMLTAELCYLNRGRWNLSGGIGLGMQFHNHYTHTIDSLGISTEDNHKSREWAGRIRLINAKFRVTNNLGAYAGLGLGYDGLATVGACYTLGGSDKKSRNKKYLDDTKLAIRPGSTTVIAAAGYPNAFRLGRGSGSISVGPFILAAEHQLSKRICIGLQYFYQYSNWGRKVYSFSGVGSTPVYAFDYKEEHWRHSLMGTADYCYVNKGRFSLSSGFGLGWTVYSKTSKYFSDNQYHAGYMGESFNKNIPAFRFRLLNVKAKITDGFGVYGGFGYGTDGIVAGGLFYNFGGNE